MAKKKVVAKKAAKKTIVVKGATGPAAKPKKAVAKGVPRVELMREVDRDDAPPRGKRGAPTKPTAALIKKAAARGSKASDEPSGIGEGDSAPSFVLKDHSGALVSSESLRGSPYLIYFYPKDDTPGCTLEACSFRDSAPRFAAKGVRVLGVSPDSPETHARFRKKYGLTFPLLSDPEKTLAKAFGVWVKKQNYGREYMGVERSTFFVDRSGIVRRAWRRVRVPGHVDEVVHTV
ncbi:MAG TPA: peroxiredoxin [Polyangiaceae bacterium]|jgi:peroxiredoxin Q/BCP|nr:peroxiredoxin [Polyangiaceae bacterium]